MLEDDYVVDSVSARMGVQGRSHERCQHGEAIHERMRDVRRVLRGVRVVDLVAASSRIWRMSPEQIRKEQKRIQIFSAGFSFNLLLIKP